MGSAELRSIFSLPSLTWRNNPGFTEMIINESAGRWAGGWLRDQPLRAACTSMLSV